MAKTPSATLTRQDVQRMLQGKNIDADRFDAFDDRSEPTLASVVKTQEMIKHRLSEITDLVESQRGSRQAPTKASPTSRDDVHRILRGR